MNSLQPPDSHHFQAASGWLDLGNWQEANAELERICPQNRTHPAVLEVRYEIYASGTRWEACVDIAETIVKLYPESTFGWIRRSYALHELKRSREALAQLLPAADLFPEEIIIRYNLACYECALGNMSSARAWLVKTFDLAQQQKCFDEYRLMALDDRDLEPFWEYLGQLEV